MEQSYSVVADMLAKFHTSSEIIQALWLVMVPATLVGITACTMWAAKEIAAAVLARRGEWQGHSIHIYRAPDGRWILHARGAVRELDGEDAERLPPLIRHHLRQ